jgi:hypothetical protein
LHIVANRAVWTYACSCATGSTEVRLVVNHARISVFAIMAPRATPLPPARAGGGLAPWLVGLGGVLLAILVSWLSLRRGPRPARRPSVAQGQLLAALLDSHAHRPGGLRRSSQTDGESIRPLRSFAMSEKTGEREPFR